MESMFWGSALPNISMAPRHSLKWGARVGASVCRFINYVFGGFVSKVGVKNYCLRIEVQLRY
ncbi:hypothetical protein [Pseudobacteroides cellulosolvens]|uniref:hypothetical protein n=1 Tax=Pseudobacteroides cellulosolvens TaxID=35825 RepID=UPI001A9A44B3|nr:hypothetical protein [Pseudobacteroides cellulosolvens]